MTANKDRISLEHDTTMCSDPKVWFPMRVTDGAVKDKT